jgi:hypothetical protein
MLHLSPERLAALADDEPLAAEAQHLARCATCVRERDAQRRLIVRSAALGATLAEVPLTSWDTLSARLREEGLLRTPAVTRGWGVRPWMRAAAAVVLAAGGTVIGRVSAGAPLVPWRAVASSGAAASIPTPRGSFANTGDAYAALVSAQQSYQNASSYLAVHDTVSAGNQQAYGARLAAYDAISAISQAALTEEPSDPMMNQLHLSALGAREETYRRLGQIVPVGATLIKY